MVLWSFLKKPFFFFYFYPHPRTLPLLLERNRIREREQHWSERRHWLAASCVCTNPGSHPQFGHAPWPGIKPATVLVMGWCSNQLSQGWSSIKMIIQRVLNSYVGRRVEKSLWVKVLFVLWSFELHFTFCLSLEWTGHWLCFLVFQSFFCLFIFATTFIPFPVKKLGRSDRSRVCLSEYCLRCGLERFWILGFPFSSNYHLPLQ